jgi:hypothetical protein
MRVFRNREEAEKAGWNLTAGNQAYRDTPSSADREWSREWAAIRTPLEAQLAEALEAVEWLRGRGGLRGCPTCGGLLKGSGHAADCKLADALRAFRGEQP